MVTLNGVIRYLVNLEPTLNTFLTIIATFQTVAGFVKKADSNDEAAFDIYIPCPIGDKDDCKGLNGLARHWGHKHKDIERQY